MDKLHALAQEMIAYERGCPQRAQHLLKVHAFARLIGTGEGLDGRTLYILEAAALVHDIGIKPALAKYGSSAGPLQEKEGIAPAREMLIGLGFDGDLTERVCTLVGRHHTYDNVDGPDCRILLEADFLVNLFENGAGTAEIQTALQRVFRTRTGIDICRTMFGLAPD